MIIDAHMHITEEDHLNGLLGQMAEDDLSGLVCGTDPLDAGRVSKLVEASNGHLKPSYGLHPWYSDRFTVSQMESWYQKCDVIGEIGMDSIWCQVDLKRQREVFGQQLEIAQLMGKPVLLHTKGQEKEIARMLVSVTVPVILHWYSCQDHLKDYLEMDSYFTVGPDVYRNKAVQQLTDQVPLERLLVESDGLNAVEWATGRKCPPEQLRPVLTETVRYIAEAKGIDFDAALTRMRATAQRVLKL